MANQRVKRRAAMIPPPGGYTNHIPATIVKGDKRTDADRAETRAAYDIWLRDLEHIRRPKPLRNSKDVVDVKIINMTSGMNAKSKKAAFVDLTDLSSGDDGDVRGGTKADKPPPPSGGRDVEEFYRGENYKVLRGDALSYQTRGGKGLNQYPSPGMLRFEMGKLRKQLGWQKKTKAEVATLARQQLWGTQASVPRTFEDSLQQNWLADRIVGTGPRLIKGLPMMEDVVFLRAGNSQGLASNCFWKAIAYHVYGHHSFDVRVKAEHLEYFSEVLRWPQHPKYTLYTEMNKRFYEVPVSASNGKSANIVVNAYQLMTIPCTYTNGALFEVTADLYNLFITVYDIYKVKEAVPGQAATAELRNVNMKGSFNDRHVFFLFLAGPSHYQPIVPNEFFASEFSQPRPSSNRTYGYPGVNFWRQDDLSTDHIWRVADTVGKRADLINRTTRPPPTIPHCDEYWIEAVVNGSETDLPGA